MKATAGTVLSARNTERQRISLSFTKRHLSWSLASTDSSSKMSTSVRRWVTRSTFQSMDSTCLLSSSVERQRLKSSLRKRMLLWKQIQLLHHKKRRCPWFTTYTQWSITMVDWTSVTTLQSARIAKQDNGIDTMTLMLNRFKWLNMRSSPRLPTFCFTNWEATINRHLRLSRIC